MNLSMIQPYLNIENLTIALGVLSALLALFSLILLSMYFLQVKRKRDIQQALRSRLQASYNQFYQIALAAEKIREFNLSSVQLEEKIPIAMNQASYIAGTANASRSDIISYSREHLRFVPVWEDPSQPYKGKLPTAKQLRRNKNSNQGALPTLPEASKQKTGTPPPPKLNL